MTSRPDDAPVGWPRDSYTGLGGGLYTGRGGGASTLRGGGLSTLRGGGLSTLRGGGLYTGSCPNPYRSNIPPRAVFLEYLRSHGYEAAYRILKRRMASLDEKGSRGTCGRKDLNEL